MIIDFQQHYTPAEMLKGDPKSLTAQVDERGNPNYLLNPQLGDLNNHVRMMDHAGIDTGVLSCGVGFDQPDLKICRAINDRMAQAEKDHPGRFIGLAHVPALKPDEARAELKRCAVDLGFPGVVIASEMQDQALDHESLQAVLQGLLRSRPLCVHPSAGQGHQLEPDGRRRSRPHVRLGVLADDRDHPRHQLRPARRTAGPENPVLAFLRRHRPLSRPLQRLPAAHQVGHLADQGPQPAAEACRRSLSQQPALL